MGLFGSNSKTYYNTSTMPIYDEDTASMLKQTIVSATATNRGIGSSLLENILNSNVTRLGALYRYAASGQYEWGLPEQTEQYLSQKTVENIALVIQTEVDEPVTLSYYVYDSFLNPDLSKEWTIPNTPNLPESPQPPSNSLAAQQGMDNYYVVEYSKVSEPEVYYKWWFKESDATDEYYSFLQVEKTYTNPYYPLIPFRLDGERLDTKPQYSQDIYRACSYLGINSTTLGDSIQEMSDANEADGNPNPMEEAYIFTGVPLVTSKQVGKEYLFKFFRQMYKTSTVTEGDYVQWLNFQEGRGKEKGAPPRNSISVKDINFEHVFSWSYIKRQVVKGKLKSPTGKAYINRGFEVEFVSRPQVSFGSSDDRYDTNYISGSSLYVRSQNRNGTYTEYEILGIGYSSLCVGKEMYYTLEEIFEPEDADQDLEKVVVPLHTKVVRQMGKIRGHDLMNIAIRMQINDKVRIKQKTNWLSIISLIVSVVVTVLFPPAGGWTMTTLLTTLGINLAVSMVMRLLSPAITKVLQDILGEELGTVLAVIVIYFVSRGASNLASSVPAASSVKPVEVSSAANVPKVAESITMTTAQYVNLAMDVAGAYQKTKFEVEMSEYNDELEKINETLIELQELEDLVGIDNISSLVVATQLQDTNDILETNMYVAKEMNKVRNVKLITETTQEYTAAMQDTGRVYSPINSARILA